MIRREKASVISSLILSCALATPNGWGFEIDTHRDMTRAAFDRSSAGDVLRSLGGDPVTPLNGGPLHGSLTPRDWLLKGSRDEDDTLSTNFARYRNHFYDPHFNRGLTTPLVSGDPAPNWALEDQQEFLTQTSSFRDAHEAFRAALLAPISSEREAALARTFEILGHVLHLSQDMAVPEHTRNDIHGGYAAFGPKSLYELHLNRPQVRARLNFNAAAVWGFGLPRDYWVTGDGRGLSQFTNRNFVSQGTNFTALVEGATGQGGYPSPVLHLGAEFVKVEDLQVLDPGLRDRAGDLVEGNVVFFANTFQDPITGGQLRNDRMTTYSFFDRDLLRKCRQPLFALNRYNVEAQASFLIPRAAGYSAGLLDYFFRGRIAIAPPDRFVYARAPFMADNSGAFTSLRFKVKNVTPNEAAGAGTLQAVVWYRTAEGNLFVNPLAPLSATPVVALSAVQEVTLTDTFQDLTFDFQAHPIPTNAADLFLTVVYQGPLGSESDALAVGGKDIREPDPVMIVEATDYDCFQGQPYYVAGLPVSARDLTGDGAQDLFGPYREQGVRVKLDPAGAWRAPTAERFDLAVAEVMGGQYAGFVVLQDQYSYQVAWQAQAFQDTSTGQSQPYTRWYNLAAIFNNVSTDPDGTVRRQVTYTNPPTFRGLTLLHGVATTTFATSDTCFQQMFTLPPAVTPVSASLSTQ